MAGHSKWSNIKRKKAAVDAKRSKVWTKVIREIQAACRVGGVDPDGNPRLRLAIDKGRAANVPKDSIKRALEKAAGGQSGDDWDEVVYEGYGPGGAAVVLECMTDNKNRTVGEIRHAFEKFGGNMGQNGSVSWMFNKRGFLYILKDQATEESLMEVALEAGAEDVKDEDEVWLVETDPQNFLEVKSAIEAAGIGIDSDEIDNVPETRVALEGENAEAMIKLVDRLEDLDDVQSVYTNHDVPEEMLSS